MKSIRKVVQRNIQRLYIVMWPRFVHFTADIFPGCKVEQGMTCFQIVPILPPPEGSLHCQKGGETGNDDAKEQGHRGLERVESLFGYNAREIESFTRNWA